MEGVDHGQMRRMFNQVAPRYNWVNDFLSFGLQRGWRRRALQGVSAPHKAQGRVLDLACGTGEFSAVLLERYTPEWLVCADVSPGMLRQARERVGALRGGVGVEFVQCAAERLPLAEGEFDLILIGYGVRNFTHLEAALQECKRVLAPGGVVLVLEFGLPRGAWGALYRFYLRWVLPFIGGLLTGSWQGYRYLSRSIVEFVEGGYWHRALKATGWQLKEHGRELRGVVESYYLSL